MGNILTYFRAFFSGIFTGLVISIPLGPAGIQSIKYTMSSGFKEGYKVCLGAIAADFSYLIIINCGLMSFFMDNPKKEAGFWIIAGILLSTIGFISLFKSHDKSKLNTFISNSKLSSFPFISGFLITFSNPMTPSLWLTLSGTVLASWYYVNQLAYFTFVFSILISMLLWFAFLNFLVVKGVRLMEPRKSSIISNILKYIIFVIGFGFVIFGLYKYVII